VPGDIIKLTTTIAANLAYRGFKYGISDGVGADGTAGNPIVIACAPGVEINPANQSNNVPALAIDNCSHVWAIEVKCADSQFGVRTQNASGTASHPMRVAHCDVEDTGHAGLTIAGWFQAIASSGGTAPAGTGNEWGFSEYIIVEGCTVARPGRISDQFGECLYLGHGGSPGWISSARNIVARYNTFTECTADYIDIKPGCSNIDIIDNVMHSGYFVSGSAMQTLYMFSGIDDRPGWADFDPRIRIEGNRIYDGNVTNSNGSSSNYVVQTSMCGVTFANNLCWGFPNGAVGFRLRSEKAASQDRKSVV